MTVTDVVWTTIDTTITITPGQTVPPTVVPFTTVVPITTTTVAHSASSTSSAHRSHSSHSSSHSKSSSSHTSPAPTHTAAPSTTSAPETAPTTTSAPVVTSAPAVTVPTDSNYQGVCSQSSPCSGDGTYYDTATSPSAPSFCGTTNNGLTQNVVALPVGMIESSDCGRSITVTYGGKTSTATVVDKCMGCQGNSVDMSRHLFSSLADLAEGRIYDVKWWFN
ncbi:hypothetical protein VTN02DRAFT_904 [Thermoascus thermophilus]